MERLLRHEGRLLAALIGVLFLVASVYTVLGPGMPMTALDMTAMRSMPDMPGATPPGAWTAGYATLVFLMWWVMMIAMMLPSAAPTVLLHAALLRRSASSPRLRRASPAFLTGYLSAWAGFSVLAAAAQWALEAAGLVSAGMMTLLGTVPGALVLIAAGVYQFSRFKQACLGRCRSPAEFLTRHMRPGVAGAFRMGVVHGAFCLGCCGFLMVLLFVGGVMNLYWIVALAVLVAVEKLVPFGAALGRMAGLGLIAWGILILAGWGG